MSMPFKKVCLPKYSSLSCNKIGVLFIGENPIAGRPIFLTYRLSVPPGNTWHFNLRPLEKRKTYFRQYKGFLKSIFLSMFASINLIKTIILKSFIISKLQFFSFFRVIISFFTLSSMIKI